MIVTIHQPDFMPWLGFFKKINQADKWVILNHTLNNPRDAAFWGRRVKILINGNPIWLSLPLEKPEVSGIIGVPINEMKYSFVNPEVFKKALGSIEMSYKRAPYFKNVFPLIERFFVSDVQLMSQRNLSFIFDIMKMLEINTELIFSDQLDCKESSTDLLIEIVKKVRGNIYLCGGGASGYQQDSLFERNGIQLRYNNFVHPEYRQINAGSFVPGLSIIDALMNLGFENVKALIS